MYVSLYVLLSTANKSLVATVIQYMNSKVQ